MKTLNTSGEGLFCGTHAIGHSIYMNWNKMSEVSRQAVLANFNTFYGLEMSMVGFKSMLDSLSYRDVQWVMAQPFDALILDRNIHFQMEAGVSLGEKYYLTSQLRPVLKEFGIPYRFYKLIDGQHKVYNEGDHEENPIIKIVSNGSHYESMVDNPCESILEKNRRWNDGNLLQERSEGAVKEMISIMSDKNKLQSDLDDLIHEVGKRINAKQNISSDKKSFYEDCSKRLKSMKQEVISAHDIDDFFKFRKELRDMSENKFLTSDQSLLVLFKRVIEFIIKIINKVIDQVSPSLKFYKCSKP